MAARKAARLTASRRKSLPRSKFGLPNQKKYPVDTVKRAVNAKARATQARKKGQITARQKALIHRKANATLRRKKRG